MENVSKEYVKKIKNIIQEVKTKPKNDMMYQNIYSCICKKNEDILSIIKVSVTDVWISLSERRASIIALLCL